MVEIPDGNLGRAKERHVDPALPRRSTPGRRCEVRRQREETLTTSSSSSLFRLYDLPRQLARRRRDVPRIVPSTIAPRIACVRRHSGNGAGRRREAGVIVPAILDSLFQHRETVPLRRGAARDRSVGDVAPSATSRAAPRCRRLFGLIHGGFEEAATLREGDRVARAVINPGAWHPWGEQAVTHGDKLFPHDQLPWYAASACIPASTLPTIVSRRGSRRHRPRPRLPPEGAPAKVERICSTVSPDLGDRALGVGTRSPEMRRAWSGLSVWARGPIRADAVRMQRFRFHMVSDVEE